MFGLNRAPFIAVGIYSTRHYVRYVYVGDTGTNAPNEKFFIVLSPQQNYQL